MATIKSEADEREGDGKQEKTVDKNDGKTDGKFREQEEVSRGQDRGRHSIASNGVN